MSSTPTTHTIFVDEAGDPGLSHLTSPNAKSYFVFAFVYCDDPRELRKRLKRLIKRLHIRSKYPPHLTELKFYLPYSDLIQQGYTVPQLNSYNANMPTVRTKALQIVCRHSTGVFAAIVDKKKARQTWTSETLGNFVFAQTLFVNVLNQLQLPSPPVVFYDKGRLSPARIPHFSAYLVNKDSYFQYRGLKRYRGSLSAPLDVSSISEAGIWAADLVAGAFYHKYANNDWSYANICTPIKIGAGERTYWP